MSSTTSSSKIDKSKDCKRQLTKVILLASNEKDSTDKKYKVRANPVVCVFLLCVRNE